MENVQDALNLLGTKVEDRVTGFKGVVTSISFDLYGCIQAIVNPGLTPDGKIGESHWFDVGRLTVSGTPVMEVPSFVSASPASRTIHDKGPAEKPAFMKP